ncbi:MAG: PKD domain-containing protein [Miltoncostaeaceae bacterium]
MTVGQTNLDGVQALLDVAAAGDGRGAIVWREALPTIGPPLHRLLLSTFDAGGIDAPVPLGPDGLIPNADVAAGADGTRVVVWAAGVAGVRAVMVAPDGSVGPVQEVAGAGSGGPRVVVDPSGRATVVFLRSDGAGTRIEYVRLSAGAPPSPAFTLSAPNPLTPAPVSDMRLSLGADGTVAAVWRHRIESDAALSRYQVRVALIPPIGPHTPARGVSDINRNAGEPAVAPGPPIGIGGFRIVWPERIAGPAAPNWEVRFAPVASSGMPLGSTLIAPDGDAQNVVDIATLPSGAGMILHSVPSLSGALSGRLISSAGVPVPGPALAPLPPGAGLSPAAGFDLAAGADGVFTLAFNNAPVLTDATIEVRRFDAAGALIAQAAIDPPDSEYPELALTAAGSVNAVWLRDDGSGHTQVRSAQFDIEGPVLSLAPAGPAVAGQPAPLAATALDRSQPITYQWSAGDGSPAFAGGASVSPTYAQAGDFTATVTATDALGRQSTATTTVSVAPAPPPDEPQPTGPAVPALLVCAPPAPPAIGPGSGRVTLTASQLRINQRISQAAVRRVAALQARTDGLPVPEDPPRGEPGRVTLTVAQLRINQRISQAALRRVNALSNRVQGLPAPAPAEGAPGRLTLSAAQLLTNQRIAQAAVRRVNALTACLDAAGV